MPDWIWRAPLLRGLSPMRRGFVEGLGVVLFASLVAGPGINQIFSRPGAVAGDLAQIGAALVIAYTVQTGWVVKTARRRGADRENWVGVAGGLSSAAVVGIGAALCLSAHEEPLNLFEGFAFAWAASSIGVLGIFIAGQPWAMHEQAHAFAAERPDE